MFNQSVIIFGKMIQYRHPFQKDLLSDKQKFYIYIMKLHYKYFNVVEFMMKISSKFQRLHLLRQSSQKKLILKKPYFKLMRKIGYENMTNQVLEDMGDICHQEWIKWSKNISKELYAVIEVLKKDIEFYEKNGIENEEAIELVEKLEKRLERWEALWIPYSELSEEMKESDRKYAKKMFDLAMESLK